MKHRETLADLQELDRRHYLHPFSDHRQIGARGTRVISRGEGVYIYEADGRRILDGMSGLWCVSLGYGRRELIEAALRQLETLPYYNSFFQCTHAPAIELAELLAEVAPPGFERVFYTNSGSEANDTIIRMVRRYWDIQGAPRRKTIISRRNAYHGSTIGGMSLGGMPAQQAQGDLPIPGIVHIEQPYWYELGAGLLPDEFGLQVAGELEQKILELGPENVAAFIGEPVQGAGGVIVPHESYWPQLRRICDKHGVLLISDEIVTGFGRIGALCGARAWGVAPDMMAMAKGINSGYVPLGVTLLNERVAGAFERPGAAAALMHGYTYGGHALACAAANANLQIVEAEDLPGRAREVGAYLNERITEFLRYPNVGDVRGRGLMAAIELVTDKASRGVLAAPAPFVQALVAAARSEGAIVRVQGNRLIVSPPLVFTRADVDEAVRILHAAFAAAGRA